MQWLPDMQKNPSVEELKISVKEIKSDQEIPEEVLEHVKHNLVQATNLSSICVDGGYTPEEALGELARAGGDLGISTALLSLGFSVGEAFSIVYQYRKDHGQKYGWHTDTHVDPKDGGHSHSEAICGCGHCNAAFLNASRYGIDSEQIVKLLEKIKEMQQNEPKNMRFVNLDREHQEEGIFVIESDEVSILPWDKRRNHQFFVYDQARDVKQLEKIAEMIQKGQYSQKINAHELLDAVTKQTNTTLGLLGSSKGKPMYTLSHEHGVVTVKLVGHAPEN